MSTAKFSQYHQMLSALARKSLDDVPLTPTLDSALSIAAARLLLENDPALYPYLAQSFQRLSTANTALTDESSHTRPVYHPLAVHIHLAAFLHHFESLPAHEWSICESALELILAPIRTIESCSAAPPPAEQTHLVLWQALCLYEAALILNRDADIEWLDAVVSQIISHPGRDNSLHTHHPDQSLDAWTYRELSGLHALANLAVKMRRQDFAARVEQIALYHLQNTQPDNTTNQPWAIFAFLWSDKTVGFAEQQLHDTLTHCSGNLSPLAAMLITDAAHTLDAFL